MVNNIEGIGLRPIILLPPGVHKLHKAGLYRLTVGSKIMSRASSKCAEVRGSHDYGKILW